MRTKAKGYLLHLGNLSLQHNEGSFSFQPQMLALCAFGTFLTSL